jgi:uncharacterized membrane protein (DUF373 family)
MENFLRKFEKYTVIALLGMMVIVVFLGLIELGIIICRQMEMVSPPLYILLDISDLLRIFGFFFLILIGLELIKTINVSLSKELVPAEVIFLVAIIAITRQS